MGLKAMVAELLKEHGVPGAAMAVAGADGSARVVTAGVRGDGRGPIEDGTVFAAASLTKPVFAAGVMALVDGGALELDRPLSEYVAEPYLAGDERAALITARMVLSHTTGFPNWRDDRPLFLRWSPGTRWGYSGEGYTYLQQVVEHLTGVPIGRYLADAVMGPLGMGRSGFRWPGTDDTWVAVGHTANGQARPPLCPPVDTAAAGGLFTTAPDYLRFLVHSLARERRSFEPQARIDDELSWGLGWGIEEGEGGRVVWQWGNDAGYKNFVLGRPADGAGVVVLTNSDGGAAVYAELVRRLFPGPHASLDRQRRLAWNTALARRPVDLGPRLDEPAVRSLLRLVAGQGDEEAVDRVADRYRTRDPWLLGMVVGESREGLGYAAGAPIACIGLDPTGRDGADITALAVLPDWRLQGFARSMVFGACDLLGLRALDAECDADAVGFYRAIGFSVERVGERYPHVERFRCRLRLPPP